MQCDECTLKTLVQKVYFLLIINNTCKKEIARTTNIYYNNCLQIRFVIYYIYLLISFIFLAECDKRAMQCDECTLKTLVQKVYFLLIINNTCKKEIARTTNIYYNNCLQIRFVIYYIYLLISFIFLAECDKRAMQCDECTLKTLVQKVYFLLIINNTCKKEIASTTNIYYNNCLQIRFVIYYIYLLYIFYFLG